MGMLLHPLDAVLSSQSKVRLLRALLPLEDAVSAREAARLAGAPLAPALRALSDLVAIGVLHRAELSTQHLYTVNRQDPLVKNGLLRLFEAERARVRAIFDWLRNALEAELSGEVVLTIAVYGSAARGDDSPESDFDVLVVTQTADQVPAVHDRLAALAPDLERAFGLDLSPLVLSQEQFRQQCAAGDSVMATAVEESRLVAGHSLDRLLTMQPAR